MGYLWYLTEAVILYLFDVGLNYLTIFGVEDAMLMSEWVSIDFDKPAGQSLKALIVHLVEQICVRIVHFLLQV